TAKHSISSKLQHMQKKHVVVFASFLSQFPLSFGPHSATLNSSIHFLSPVTTTIVNSLCAKEATHINTRFKASTGAVYVLLFWSLSHTNFLAIGICFCWLVTRKE